MKIDKNNFTELKSVLEKKYPVETKKAQQHLNRAMKAMRFHQPQEPLLNLIYWALIAETTCNVILSIFNLIESEEQKPNEN